MTRTPELTNAVLNSMTSKCSNKNKEIYGNESSNKIETLENPRDIKESLFEWCNVEAINF